MEAAKIHTTREQWCARQTRAKCMSRACCLLHSQHSPWLHGFSLAAPFIVVALNWLMLCTRICVGVRTKLRCLLRASGAVLLCTKSRPLGEHAFRTRALTLQLKESLLVVSRYHASPCRPFQALESLSTLEPCRMIPGKPTLRHTVAPL